MATKVREASLKCHDADGSIDVGVAIAYGLNLGAQARPLLAQRWEDGWQTPLEVWRERLGICPLLQTSPFPRLPGEVAHS